MARVVGLKTYDAGLGEWVDAISNPELIALGLIVDDNTADIVDIHTNGVEKLKTARTIAITGEATGTSAAFDGTGNVSIEVTIAQMVKQAIIDAALPTGMIGYYPKNAVPNGWLKCNGQAVSRDTYANLFAVIGTSFGTGDGTTTFNLPDLRGNFVRGLDDGRGIDTGRTIGSTQEDDIKAHTHLLYGTNGGGDSTGGSNSVPKLNSSLNTWGWVTATNTGGSGIMNTGGTETRPKNIALLAVIKY